MQFEDLKRGKYTVCYFRDKGIQKACSLGISTMSRLGTSRNFMANGEITASTCEALPDGAAVRVIIHSQSDGEIRRFVPQDETTVTRVIFLDERTKEDITRRLVEHLHIRQALEEEYWPESLRDYARCLSGSTKDICRFWVDDYPEFAQALFVAPSQ